MVYAKDGALVMASLQQHGLGTRQVASPTETAQLLSFESEADEACVRRLGEGREGKTLGENGSAGNRDRDICYGSTCLKAPHKQLQQNGRSEDGVRSRFLHCLKGRIFCRRFVSLCKRFVSPCCDRGVFV